ncbi:MAG: flavodoxin family protein [Clostridia bacterium]|nr:flavodoxin family protein [Clostridia bacterium]
MSKVIGINGSPRADGNSAALLRSALEGAAVAGAETELVQLGSLNFSGCISCFACKLLGGPSFGRCAVKDELSPLLERILEADALLVSMPIYFGDVPGMVRNLFERLWFPALLYRRDGAIAYEKRVKVGLLYTMNVPNPRNYDQLIRTHKASFDYYLGETQTLCSADTHQFSDYSLYTGDLFNPEGKRQRRETQFPVDCAKAKELGAALVR